jgi:hypothetical protein
MAAESTIPSKKEIVAVLSFIQNETIVRNAKLQTRNPRELLEGHPLRYSNSRLGSHDGYRGHGMG